MFIIIEVLRVADFLRWYYVLAKQKSQRREKHSATGFIKRPLHLNFSSRGILAAQV
jgi:hypothetical protein